MPQAFIIMQIGNREVERVAASAIVPALLECGLEPKRVDKHNQGGLLKSEIIRFIQKSEIVVADLTNERPNCYLEVGYAMGIDKFKNLILTAREDHFTDSQNYVTGGPRIHFDLAGYDILRWHPGNLDGFRSELEKRIRRRLAIISSGPESSSASMESDWFASQGAAADEGLKKTPWSAYMELAFALSSRTEQFSLPQLNKAAESAPIHTFGWPIALYLHKEGLRPRPRSDGVFAEIIGETTQSYDYWALRRNGDFFWRGSLLEDERRPGEIFFDTRIVRVTEALLYCGRLYSALGLDRARVVSIHVRHVGLKERRLTSANPSRYISIRSPSADNESDASITVRLEQIETDLVTLVKTILAPLFSLFDFFELSDSVYEDLVSKFVKGRV